MKFLDQAKIYVRSGDGGDGVAAFRREKYIEFGGPDGGNGGRGAHIIFRATDGLNTLIDFRYTQHFRGRKGGNGSGSDRTGAAAKDIVIDVPVGTQIMNESRDVVLADLTKEGQTIRLCRGGDGGHGNAHYKSSTNRAPRRADPGYPGEEMWVWLRLKLLADAGLVGLPNAGKSTLLSLVSRAHPKIANYPFTTIHPQLGVAQTSFGETFVLADIPGLIEGAHEGTGLGTRFLGHIERCGALLHLVAADSEDIARDYKTIREELRLYGADLLDKPEIVVLSKADLATPEKLVEQAKELEKASGQEPITISQAAREGIPRLVNRAYKVIEEHRRTRDEANVSISGDMDNATNPNIYLEEN